jgi:hypothetical protein
VHPWASASIALGAVVVAIFAVRWVVRAFRRMFGRTSDAMVVRPQTKSA